MRKTTKWDAAAAQLRQCGESLIGASETLRALIHDDECDVEATPVPEAVPSTQPLTLEEVRAVLGDKSTQGHTAKVQALIHKRGAEKLSQVDPAEYAALLAEAEAL